MISYIIAWGRRYVKMENLIYMKTVGGCVVFMDNFSDRRRMNGRR